MTIMTTARTSPQGFRTVRSQLGAVSVEFAIAFIVFVLLAFAILEFGRMLYLWNAVQEVTRRAAREAVVNFTTEQASIQRAAVFRAGTSGEVGMQAASEVTNLKVSIVYLNSISNAGVGVPASPLPASPSANLNECSKASSSCINFVQVKICEVAGSSCNPVRYVPMLAMFSFLGFDIPASTVVMPAESLGFSK